MTRRRVVHVIRPTAFGSLPGGHRPDPRCECSPVEHRELGTRGVVVYVHTDRASTVGSRFRDVFEPEAGR